MAGKKKKEEVVEDPYADFYDLIGENHFNQGVDEYLPTGVKQYDFALSGRYINGGFGCSRIHEIYGGESSGKTMIATMAMAEAQRRKGIAVFLDYEHSFDMQRAQTLGLSMERGKWFYQQPETAEDGFEIIEKMANMMSEKYPDQHICVVVDSVASMNTKEELEAGFEQNMRTKLSLAACMSSSLKRIKTLVSSCKMTLIFLNQTRTNPSMTFGDSDTVAGGNALKFYASTRTKLSKFGKIKEGDEVIGENVKALIIKNKIYMPFKVAQYKTDFSQGVDVLQSHFDELERLKLITKESEFITKAGAWFSIDGVKYQGWNNFKDGIINTPGAYDKMLEMFSNVPNER